MISSITAIFIIGIIIVAIITYNNQKNKEKQETTKVKQEMETQQDLDQGAELNLDRGEQSSQDKWEDAWAALNENQEYLALGSEHLKRTIEKQGNATLTTITYTEEFIGTLYMIQEGWFIGINNQELVDALTEALAHIEGDTATGKEVYDALCEYISVVNRSAVISGTGEAPFSESTNNTVSQKDNQNQSSNNQSINKNNNQSSNKNNNSNNTPPSDSDDSGDDEQTRGTSNLPDGWTDESDDFDPDNVIHDPDDGSSGWNP